MKFLFQLVKGIALQTESLSLFGCYQPRKFKRK